jgi:hypothetical protein
MSAPEQPIQPNASPGQFSPDGKYWWDGQQWVPAVSQDGKQRWNGTAWVPNRKMFLGDHANQSIACVIIGLLCAPFFPYGIYAGWKALQEVPQKRTLAIVGIVLNSVGTVLWVLGLIYRVSTAGSSS